MNSDSKLELNNNNINLNKEAFNTLNDENLKLNLNKDNIILNSLKDY